MIPTGVQLKVDHRDKLWSYHRNQKFGAILPPTLNRTMLPSMDQYYTYLCTAYSTALAGAYHMNTPMSGEWQSGKVSEMVGSSIAHEGADPRKALKAAIVWGHLPKSKAPFTLEDKGEDYVADWSHYPSDLDKEALPNKWNGYMPIIPKDTDMFDAIREAMANEYAKHGDKASPAMAATDWYANFNTDAVVNTMEGATSAHMYTFVDYISFGGTDFLVAQSSSGNTSVKRFSRSVVNKLFQNPAAFCAIFTEEERGRLDAISEALYKLLYALQNYVSDIMK